MSKNKKEKKAIKDSPYWYLIGVEKSNGKISSVAYAYTKEAAKAYARDREAVVYVKVPKDVIIKYDRHGLEPVWEVKCHDELYVISDGEFEDYQNGFADHIATICTSIDGLVNSIPCIKFTNKELSKMMDFVYFLKDSYNLQMNGDDGIYDMISEEETIKYYLTVTGAGHKKRKKYVKEERARIEKSVKDKKKRKKK